MRTLALAIADRTADIDGNGDGGLNWRRSGIQQPAQVFIVCIFKQPAFSAPQADAPRGLDAQWSATPCFRGETDASAKHAREVCLIRKSASQRDVGKLMIGIEHQLLCARYTPSENELSWAAFKGLLKGSREM